MGSKSKTNKQKAQAQDWEPASRRPNKLFSEGTGPFDKVEQTVSEESVVASGAASPRSPRPRTPPGDLEEELDYGDRSSSSRSETPRARSTSPYSQRSGPAPKAEGPTVIMSLEDMTVMTNELYSLRAALVEQDKAPTKSWREVVQPPPQTQPKRQLQYAAKSDVSVDLEDPELVEERAALAVGQSQGAPVPCQARTFI